MTAMVLRYLGVLIAAVALLWLGSHWALEWDLSASGRHTLSPASVGVLERIDGPVQLTAWVGEDAELKRAVTRFVDRYQRRLPSMTLTFADPQDQEETARELGIPASGAVQVDYAGGTELLRQLNEVQLTSALQRLLMRGERWVVAVQGHGERRFDGDANHDYRDFARALKRDGFHLHDVNLAAAPVPGNTGVLVVGDPRVAFMPEEQLAVADHIASGGNLLWFSDSGRADVAPWLWDQLPVSPLPGTVVDAGGAGLGLDDPRMVAVGAYAAHPVTTHLELLTLFPRVLALEPRAAAEEWTTTVLLASSGASWNETGEVRGDIRRDAAAGESAGPLPLAVALERGEQRIVVVGDGDFLSNAYLGNGGNLDLGLAMVRWLTHNDALITIPAPAATDARIEMPRKTVAMVAGIFLVGVPLLLVVTGLWITLRRKRR